MRDAELDFRDRLGDILGNYCPSDSVLNNLSFFLYQEVISSIRNSTNGDKDKVIDEIFNTPSNEKLAYPSFIGAVRNFSAFTSQYLMIDTLKRSLAEIKNTIPMAQRAVLPNDSGVGKTVVQSTKSSNHAFVEVDNTKEFDFDLASAVDNSGDKFIISGGKIITEEDLQQEILESREGYSKGRKSSIFTIHDEVDKNVFDGDGVDIDLDEINLRTNRPKRPVQSSFVDSGSSGSNRSDEVSFTTNASNMTDGGFDSLPSMSFDDEDY